MDKQELKYWCKDPDSDILHSRHIFITVGGQDVSTVFKPEREMKYPGCLTFTLITPLECAGNCHDLADSLISCYKTISDCSVLLLKG